MPELPEVETVVRDIRPRVVGRRIHAVRHASPLMAQSQVGSFKTKLAGREIRELVRHGKWMFFRLTDDNTLVIHLGMTGRLLVEPARSPVARHTHLRLGLDEGGEELRFIDPRRFGELALYSPAGIAARFGAPRLGPDATRVTRRQLAASVTRAHRRLKAILLDQRVVAGIGNIYADEILFAARLAPQTLGTELAPPEIDRLHRALRRVLARAIRHNGTSIRDYVTGQGVPGDFQRLLRVYGRAKLPCKICQHPIELNRGIVTGRATHWCPACQTRATSDRPVTRVPPPARGAPNR